VLGALKRSGDPEIDRRLAAIAEHETNQAGKAGGRPDAGPMPANVERGRP